MHDNHKRGGNAVKRTLLALSLGMMIAGSGAAMAANETMSSVPSNAVTVTDWYKQNVYDSQNNKIGSIEDVLVSPEGKVNALILSADGRNVAINFDSVKRTMQNNNVRLTMNANKDEFKNAPSLKYDKNATKWVPDTSKDTNR